MCKHMTWQKYTSVLGTIFVHILFPSLHMASLLIFEGNSPSLRKERSGVDASVIQSPLKKLC